MTVDNMQTSYYVNN